MNHRIHPHSVARFQSFLATSLPLGVAVMTLLLSGCQRGGRARSVFEYSSATRSLRLTAVRDDVLHIQVYHPAGQPSPDRGWVIPDMPEATGSFTIKEEPSVWMISTSALSLTVRKQDVGMTIRNRAGRLLSEDIRAPYQGSRVETRKKLTLDQSFYGTGLRLGQLNKIGRRLELWNSDPLEDGSVSLDEDPMQMSIPLLLCTQDTVTCGILLNTTWRAAYDIGYSSPDELRISADGGTLDYLLFYGPSIQQVLKTCADFLGYPPLPPIWALGLQIPITPSAPFADLHNTAEEIRKHNIPCDILWIDHSLRSHGRIFTWDSNQVPNPVEFLGDLHSMGYRVLAEVDPGVRYSPDANYQTFDQGVRGDLFLTTPEGHFYVGQGASGSAVFPDITLPKACDWWTQQVDSWTRTGIDGVWITRNEPLAGEPKTGMPLDLRFDGNGNRTDLREAHNIYSDLFTSATRKGLDSAHPGQRTFVATESGYAGVIRNASTWMGVIPTTWIHFKVVPSALLNLSLSGVGFAGVDIGGATRITDTELYIRWFELAAYTPLMRHRPIQSESTVSPWSQGRQAEAIARKVTAERYRLIPYWYSLMQDYSRTAIPPMRPLFFDRAYDNDPNAKNLVDQWLVGPNLLVAPVIERGTRTRTVYLPAGAWTEIRTGRVYEGPLRVTVDAPLDEIPIFAREGAIIPSWPLVQSLSENKPDTLILDLYAQTPGVTGSFVFTADDGITVHSGKCISTFKLARSGTEYRLDLKQDRKGFIPIETHFLLIFHHLSSPPSSVVFRSGNDAATTLLRSDGEPMPFTWTWDAKSETVRVLVPQQDERQSVELLTASR
ncbi:MAG: TIM-barrel domain-containing protein [bacterium]